jgi:translation initiation factor IF-3
VRGGRRLPRRSPPDVFPSGRNRTAHEEPPIATPSSNNEPRINDRIRAREVRLVGPDGAQIGIKPLPEALAYARQLDLDLVEVAAMANPPVCRVMDYGKYKYEAAQQAKESRRKSSAAAIKEMKYRPKIGAGDFDTKTQKVEKFLTQGHKVKVTIMFRGREMQHPELGHKILERVADAVAHVGRVEVMPKLDGRNMVMVLAPDKRARAAWEKAKAEEAAARAGEASEGGGADGRDAESAKRAAARTPAERR